MTSMVLSEKGEYSLGAGDKAQARTFDQFLSFPYS